MGIKQKLTPERFLSAPRRGVAVPNQDGTLAFFSVSTHTFGSSGQSSQGTKGTTKKEIAMLDLATGKTWTAWDHVEDVHDVNWIPKDKSGSLLWLENIPGRKGETALIVSSPPPMPTWTDRDSVTSDLLCLAPESQDGGDGGSSASYVAGTIPAPVHSLKLCALKDGSVACALVGLVGPDGKLFNEVTAEKSPSTARIYDGWSVREWDTYVKPQKYSIWYSKLARDEENGGWKLAAPFQNALRDTDLQSPDNIYEPDDALDAFDVGPHGIALVARNPWPESPESAMCSDVYFVPLDSFTEAAVAVSADAADANTTTATASSSAPAPPQQAPPPPPPSPPLSPEALPPLPPRYQPPTLPPRPPNQPPPQIAMQITTQGRRFPGWCSSPRFSPDGTMLAYLKRPLDRYPDARLLLGHVGRSSLLSSSPLDSFDVFDVITGREWDLRPSAIAYHRSGGSLLVTADDCARVALYRVELSYGAVPRLLFKHGSVAGSGFYDIRDEGGKPTGQLLVSSSSMLESSAFYVIDDGSDGEEGEGQLMGFEPRVLACATKGGARFGLSPSQVSEIYFEGGGVDGSGGDYCVQAWIVRPSDFDEGRKYPVILLIHGGPASASRDDWHPRWNPVVWAEQGYVVVLPNISGSVGFGVPFTTSVFGQYGGRPYHDLVNCMAHLARYVPYVDTQRAVAAGGSYGGFMVNYILGHPSFSSRFKALLTQDGIFSLPHQALSQDVLGDTGEFRGPPYPWNNHAELARWSPARPDLLRNWTSAPPTLVVHNERDYRCPVTEGLAAFRTLQLMGVPSRLLTFPDEGHWVLKPENALEWHRVVFEWFGKYTGRGHGQGQGHGHEHGEAEEDRRRSGGGRGDGPTSSASGAGAADGSSRVVHSSAQPALPMPEEWR